MDNAPYIAFNVGDRSYLAGIKKEIHRLALQENFDQKRVDEIDIIVAEIGTNLVKHTSGGEILAGFVSTDKGKALELISIDNGPGISDPERMLQDGVSTTRTLGQGLGSIRRLSDAFDLYTQRGWGTILLSRVYQDPHGQKTPKSLWEFRSIVVAKPGETVSGDGYYSFIAPDGTLRLLLADGLGHGREAFKAVLEAITAFRNCDSDSPVEILRLIHASIKKSRGIVGMVMVLDPVEMIWKFCGIGNIATRFNGFQQSKSHLSYNGIIGHNIPTTLNDQRIGLNDYQQIILCSDGIRSRWEQAKYPGIQKYDLVIQAAAVYKDFARKTDDMSIVVGRAIT